MDQLNAPSTSPLIPPDQDELWSRFNATVTPAPTTVWELFRRQVEVRPDQEAVAAAKRRLTFAELAALALSLAEALRDARARGTVVVCVEPGWEQVAAVLGTLAAGLSFRPVDPRLQQSARWSQVAAGTVVLTQSWLDERLTWPPGTVRIAVDTTLPTAVTGDGPDQNSENRLPDLSLACMLAPDGVSGALCGVSNAALADTVQDLADRFSVGPGDKVLAVCPLGDEVSVYSLLGMLAVGAGVVVPDDIDLQAPPVWVTLIQREHVTVWHSPPTLAGALLDHVLMRGEGVPDSLRLVLLGGEPLTPSLAARLRQTVGPDVRIANLCAVAPAGLWAAGLEIGEPEARRGHVPVGRPLAGKKIYVLNDAQNLCPVWVPGRMHVAGRGVPDGTDDPGALRHPVTGEPLYRTALTGRLLPDGTLEVVSDDGAMTTVHDHPLNLRDVEALVSTHEGVAAAAAVATGESSVVYARPLPGSGVTESILLAHLRSKMSPYLLPSRIELLYVFPLTPSGRVDRSALAAMARPAPEPAAGSTASTDSPPDSLAAQACELAARILGVPSVERTTNLLDAGATSIQIVRLAVQAEQELAILVDVQELLRFPSVEVLLSFAEGAIDASGAADADSVGQADSGAGTGETPGEATAGLILDPVERSAFAAARPGIRRDLGRTGAVALSRPGDAEALSRRSTVRSFSPAPLPVTALSRLLALLRELQSDGGGTVSKLAYPSASSLYPVQTYVIAHDGRVQDLPAGGYYYHPIRHELLPVCMGEVVRAGDHAWVNQTAYRTSAFTLLLVAQLNAVTPMYGVKARDYALIEAGTMCQLLMENGPVLGIGLCPVGEMDFSRIRDLLRLDEHADLVLSLLGGLPDAEPDQDRQRAMLRRVGGLPAAGLPPELRS